MDVTFPRAFCEETQTYTTTPGTNTDTNYFPTRYCFFRLRDYSLFFFRSRLNQSTMGWEIVNTGRQSIKTAVNLRFRSVHVVLLSHFGRFWSQCCFQRSFVSVSEINRIPLLMHWTGVTSLHVSCLSFRYSAFGDVVRRECRALGAGFLS